MGMSDRGTAPARRGCGDGDTPPTPVWRPFAERALDTVLEALSPTRCVGCERAGVLICDDCLARLRLIDPRESCTRCGAPFGRLLCTECAGDGEDEVQAMADALDGCLACAVYEQPLPRIIKGYKDGGERRLAPIIAELLFDTACHAASTAPDRYGGILAETDAVVFVPATAAAFRRRGFDHMEAVARPFCEIAGLPLCDALAKGGSLDQRSLGREERRARSSGLYHTVEDVAGMRLLLLDDVITTGATMAAAARELKRAGAASVRALALARVW